MEATPEQVFDSLSKPKGLERWFLSKAELDPKVGGRFVFDWVGGYHMVSKVKRFETNKAIAFAWVDKMDDGGIAKTTASFHVSKKGKGTLLRLRHTGFTDPNHFAECSSRWAYYLMNLKSVLTEGVDLRSKNDW